MQEFTIPGRLPALNEYTRTNRSNKYAGNRMKRDAMEQVAWAIKAADLKPITDKVQVIFQWHEANRKRDLDNICFARKFILDALQMPIYSTTLAGEPILEGDGWKHVVGFVDAFAVDKENPRIIVGLMEVGDVSVG